MRTRAVPRAELRQAPQRGGEGLQRDAVERQRLQRVLQRVRVLARGAVLGGGGALVVGLPVEVDDGRAADGQQRGLGEQRGALLLLQLQDHRGPGEVVVEEVQLRARRHVLRRGGAAAQVGEAAQHLDLDGRAVLVVVRGVHDVVQHVAEVGQRTRGVVVRVLWRRPPASGCPTACRGCRGPSCARWRRRSRARAAATPSARRTRGARPAARRRSRRCCGTTSRGGTRRPKHARARPDYRVPGDQGLKREGNRKNIPLVKINYLRIKKKLLFIFIFHFFFLIFFFLNFFFFF